MPSVQRQLSAAAVLSIVAALTALAPAAMSAKKAKTERFLHPDFAAYQVRTIALLPVAMLVQVNKREQIDEPADVVRRHVERAVQPSGYKFMDERSLHAAAKTAGVGEALEAMEGSWRKSGELDTTTLKALGGARLADAVLATMVTTWNRVTVDATVAGQSITEVGVLLSLYSTRTGGLLWRDAYLEKGEGPYNNPGSGYVTGVQGSALGNTARNSTALDPPSYDEVVMKVDRKIAQSFPPVPKAAPPAPAGAAPDSAARPGS